MKFDFADITAVAETVERVRDTLDGVERNCRYEAVIESVGGSVRSAVDGADCRLAVVSEDDPAARPIPALPATFDITLRRTVPVVPTLRDASRRLDRFTHRARLSARGCGRDPLVALYRLRNNRVVLHLEAERLADGEFEPLVWGTGTQVFTESVAEVDHPGDFETVDVSLEARMLARWDEFAESAPV
ncbi:MAG: hypothetical protein ABEJ73_11655 [Haloplanus sp.]